MTSIQNAVPVTVMVCLSLMFLCSVIDQGCHAALMQQAEGKGSKSDHVTQKQESESENQQKEEAKNDDKPGVGEDDAKQKGQQKKKNWRSLFDGKSLKGWESIEFGGEGDISVTDGEIRMFQGDSLTGICVTDDVELPKVNYEISLKAMKRNGTDFFCGLTFPVDDSFCTLIVGGWGGSLVGLSNLDDQDASANETRCSKKFEKGKWYTIQVKVQPERISVRIDDKKMIDVSTKDKKVSIRGDVISTTPLGITNFITSSSIKDIKIRSLEQP